MVGLSLKLRPELLLSCMCLCTSVWAQPAHDAAAWRAYEAAEEAWIRECHGVLVQQAPAAINAAEIDLEIKLLELHRRTLQYRHIQKCEPTHFSGAVWEMVDFSVPSEEVPHLAAIADYRRVEERLRQLNHALEQHPQCSILKRAQARLWKTPQYRDAHRRYTGKLQELNALYGTQPLPSASTVN